MVACRTKTDLGVLDHADRPAGSPRARRARHLATRPEGPGPARVLFGPVQLAATLLALLLPGLVPSTSGTATAPEQVTVATALGRQDGSTATVRGYVVGQPTG